MSKTESILYDYEITYDELELGTTYYYRAFAINSVGVGYSEELSFTTSVEAPCEFPYENKMYLNDQSRETYIYNRDFETYETIRVYSYVIKVSYGKLLLSIYGNKESVKPKEGRYEVIPEEGKSKIFRSRLEFQITNTFDSYPAEIPSDVYIEYNDSGDVVIIFCDVDFENNLNIKGQVTDAGDYSWY